VMCHVDITSLFHLAGRQLPFVAAARLGRHVRPISVTSGVA